MFYSRQLLARKAPMGQIWMAATTHAKINRKKLDKLDIIKICEQILNPSVPMALRLSGILMGGVVIVYERKVKLLFDDVNRLLVELNQAWKVKSVTDPTVLPKGKSQAKYEAVTLPQVREEDIGETEQSFQCPRETTMMGFTETAYFAMRLDNMDDSYINQNPQEDPPQDYHQANTADITLFDCFDPSLADTSMYNRLERFDIEGDEDTQFNSTAQERTAIPSTLIPSPPPEDKPQEADEILEQYPQDQVYQQAAKGKENLQGQFRQGPTRRRARRPAALAMDNNQTIIPGEIYQSWLNGTSDITSRTRKKKHTDAMSKRKIADLMELPPTVLFDRLFTYGNKEVHYPGPLLELWIKSTQPLHDSPSGTTSTPPKPSSTSPPEGIHDQDPHGYPFEDFHSGVGPQNLGVVDSLEKLRINQKKNNLPSAIRDAINAGVPHGGSFSMTNLMATPGNSSDEVRSIPSSGSGHGLLSHNSDINSARSNKKRPNSSSRDQVNGLEPVAEEKSGQSPERILKWARLSENGLLPENELMVETGPTQSQQHPLTSQATDQITRSIQMHLKAHFETPGSSKTESLNELATGMDKKKAASLFYQTCVLATIDVIKVQQRSPYGDILISRGAKM